MSRKLNLEQENIVYSDLNSPILVYAGPGSGKTEVIAYRIIRLITEKPEDNFLVLTFGKKAGDNIRKRVDKCLKDQNRSLPEDFKLQDRIKTFHKFAYQFAKEHKSKILKKPIKTSDSFRDKANIKKYIERQEWNLRLADPRVMDDIISILSLMQIEFYRKNLEPLSEEEMSTKRQEWLKKKLEDTPTLYGLNDGMFKDIFNKHRMNLKNEGALDYDETLVYCRDAFRDLPEKCKKVSEKYKYILIDEFQDINIIQFEIVSLLTRARESNASLFCVGDPNQSILGFSGGTPQVFKLFLNQFKNSKAMPLRQNYRSTKKIVNISTKFISDKDDTAQGSPTLFTDNPGGEDVVFCESLNAKKEAELLFECANELIRQDEKIEILFLYRNRQESKEIKKLLDEKQVKYVDLSRESFELKPELMAIIYHCKYFLDFKGGNPDYQNHIKHFYNKPANGLGAKYWEKITAIVESENKTIKEVLSSSENYPELAKGKLFKGTKLLLAHLEKIENIGYGSISITDIFESFYSLTGFKQKWESDIAKASKAAWNSNNVIQYLEELKSFKKIYSDLSDSQILSKSITSFKDKLYENENIINIYLSTIHNCKGAEYDAVFLTNLIDGILPFKYSISDKDTLLEETNLMYVAMTRAKRLLYLSTYKLDSSKKPLTTSRYYGKIKEICKSDNSNILVVRGKEFVGITEEVEIEKPKKIHSGTKKRSTKTTTNRSRKKQITPNKDSHTIQKDKRDIDELFDYLNKSSAESTSSRQDSINKAKPKQAYQSNEKIYSGFYSPWDVDSDTSNNTNNKPSEEKSTSYVFKNGVFTAVVDEGEKKQKEETVQEIENTVAPVKQEKKSWYSRLINKIKGK